MMRKVAIFLAVMLVAAAGWGQFPFPVAHFSAPVVEEPSDAGCCGTRFNGSSQYLQHTDGSGFADSQRFTMSFWVRRDRTGVDERILGIGSTGSPTARFLPGINAANQIILFGRNSASETILNLTGSTTITDNEWHHVVASVDLAETNNRHLYIDDTMQTLSVTTYDDDTLDFTGNSYSIAANPGGGSGHFDGALSEVWVDFGTYVDLSVTANRRLFITAGGLPAELGSDGSGPTGNAPEVYLSDAGGTNTGTTAAFSAVGSPPGVAGPNP